jgi:hypothetical protein
MGFYPWVREEKRTRKANHFIRTGGIQEKGIGVSPF